MTAKPRLRLNTNSATVLPSGFDEWQNKKRHLSGVFFCFGDPYENRTRVTAVKGRCLNLLTNGPGSGNWTRTHDLSGMNRLL